MSTALRPEQLRQFEEDGFLVLRQRVAPATCDDLLALTQSHLAQAIGPLEYEAEVGYPGAPVSLAAPGGQTLRRLRGAYQRAPLLQQWASDPALVASLEQLFGEPVCLSLAHHNCVMTKHPDFGTATGWHRDIRYWSFTRPDLVSVWLALDAETAHNGALKVIPGSHRMDIRREQLDDMEFLRPDLPENQALCRQGVTVELQKGDVLLFHSLLFHAAGRNDSDRLKASVVFAYHACSNPPTPGSRSDALGSVALPGA